jgi:hypothetical protein
MQGRDAGELKLRLTYVPLQRCNPLVGDFGALFVYVRKGRDFPRMEPSVEDSCNPYYLGKVGEQKQTCLPVYNTTVLPARLEFCFGYLGSSSRCLCVLCGAVRFG